MLLPEKVQTPPVPTWKGDGGVRVGGGDFRIWNFVGTHAVGFPEGTPWQHVSDAIVPSHWSVCETISDSPGTICNKPEFQGRFCSAAQMAAVARRRTISRKSREIRGGQAARKEIATAEPMISCSYWRKSQTRRAATRGGDGSGGPLSLHSRFSSSLPDAPAVCFESRKQTGQFFIGCAELRTEWHLARLRGHCRQQANGAAQRGYVCGRCEIWIDELPSQAHTPAGPTQQAF